MFTGIVDHCGKVRSVEILPQLAVVHIETKFFDLQIGESIAMDGVCVTVAKTQSSNFFCELSSETVSHTSARLYKVGDLVNLERALRLMDRMGGHFVTGHVDQTVTVALLQSNKQSEFVQAIFVGISKEVRCYLIKKGSVSISGVSLTVNNITKNTFSVMLIPHTLKKTNLKNLIVGHVVNVEFDLIAKIVAQTTREIVSDEKSV
ncbi:riboflavin synthase [Coxiella endosymbiont of Amblyomma americanum]|uniref:riboflavin synthase n=1 Tax=Coxiella endosymbiont of Amblyomma americanum TaxID=325775 RepID=UPI000580688B|nr:riboflavin synthase [Coxiella endosymbiont of Amblyomma americanum]AJC50322.1 riboflavin synthase subunit alpha [Coxiella endosymbiont of Amblyomma americanum]AUJ58669.1 riboflavin synthase [Coxiella-like endosymbiont of Amblyomma americanum]